MALHAIHQSRYGYVPRARNGKDPTKKTEDILVEWMFRKQEMIWHFLSNPEPPRFRCCNLFAYSLFFIVLLPAFNSKQNIFILHKILHLCIPLRFREHWFGWRQYRMAAAPQVVAKGLRKFAKELYFCYISMIGIVNQNKINWQGSKHYIQPEIGGFSIVF